MTLAQVLSRPEKLPELVLFDLDGTLVDSAQDLSLSVAAVLSALGYRAPAPQQVRQWVGNGAEMLLRRALAHSGEQLTPEAVESTELELALALFRQDYGRRCLQATGLYPGVTAYLDYLAGEGTAMALVTNKPEAFTHPILRALGIEGYFSLVLGGDSLPQKKPHPMPLLHALDYFQVRGANALMVGDSRNDIDAAQQARIPVVAVSYGYNHGEDIATAGADLVVDSLQELIWS